MPWGRCDDTFYRHRKVGELDPETELAAVGLYWKAISWSNDQLTDGRVPGNVVRTLGGSVALAEELVRVGLWERGDRAYLIHHFTVYNKTKAQVVADRAQRTEAGRLGGLARWRSDSGSLSDSPTEMHGEMPTEPTGEMDAPSPVPRSPVTRPPVPRGNGAAAPPPSTPGQIVRRWLAGHGAAQPTGWVTKTLNELVQVYGGEAIIAVWDKAPKDVRTSKQFVQLAERSLSVDPKDAVKGEREAERDKARNRGREDTQKYLADLRGTPS